MLGGASKAVWSASGDVLLPIEANRSASDGTDEEIAIPAVDQDGWVDGSGRAFKGWSYKAVVTFKSAEGRTHQESVVFKPLVGQSQIDLDLLPSSAPGVPSSGDIAVVTSINGLTGAVELDGAGGVPESVIDEKDAATLEAAQEFTREQVEANPGGVSEQVVDDKIATAIDGIPEGVTEETVDAKISAAVDAFPAPDVDLATVNAKDEAVLEQARAYVDEQPIYEAIEVDGDFTLEVAQNVMYEFTGAGNVTLEGSPGMQAALVQSGTVTVNGEAVSPVTVAIRKGSGWELLSAGGAPPTPPEAPTLTVSNVTTSSVTVTWAAVGGAAGYRSRINSGAVNDLGNVLTWTASGLPASSSGVIEVAAVGAAGQSSWVGVPYTTSAPTPQPMRMTITNPASTTETGNATTGWNYAFAATPYGQGLHSGTKRIPADADGFIEFTIDSVTAATNNGLSAALHTSAATNIVLSTEGMGVHAPIISSTGKYTPWGNPPQGASSTVAENNDRVRLARTSRTTLSFQVSKNGGVTYTTIYSKLSTLSGAETSPALYAIFNGNGFTAAISNVRSVGFV